MPNYSLSIDSGALTIDGTAIAFRYFHLDATSGSLTITGTAALMEHGGHLDGTTGALTITGTAVTLTYKTWAEQQHAIMFIPYLTCDATNSGMEYALPVLTIESEGYAGLTGYLIETFPVLSSTGESNVWSFADDIDVPILECTGESGAIGEFDVVVITASGTGHLNEIGEFDETLKVITLSSTGFVSESSNLDSSLPKLALEANGTGSMFGTLSVVLPSLEMDISSGYVIPVGTGSMNLPVFETNKCGGVSGRFTYPVYNDL
jgi:hypothetical protein